MLAESGSYDALLKFIQMSADEEMTQRSDDAHMVDEPTNEALEPISTPSQSQPSSPPLPAPSGRKRYRVTAPAAVERSLASVVQQVAEGDTTIDNEEEEAKEKGEEEGMSQVSKSQLHSLHFAISDAFTNLSQ
jgi:hypothetical protein